MKTVFVEKESYYDSALLMLTSQEVKKTSGVHDATVAMGTAMNLDLLRSLGFEAAALAEATPNDLVIAVDCDSAESAEAARAAAKQALSRKSKAVAGDAAHVAPTSLASALRAQADANLAVISLPGAYAAREARKALESGLHVMLFSDNVSLADEIALKTLGRSKGLLLMGPDCGTAIINGMPLCFANVVKRGPVGVIGASGTGIQEVTCLVDRAGSGVSQAIGAGGRDLISPEDRDDANHEEFHQTVAPSHSVALLHLLDVDGIILLRKYVFGSEGGSTILASKPFGTRSNIDPCNDEKSRSRF